MPAPILYLGDTTLTTAAAYLAGVMSHAGWTFDYLPSDQACSAEQFVPPRSLVVLSDYPASRMPVAACEALIQSVSEGTGLLMLGGWESFHGCGGNWDGSPLAEILPVRISSTDDRRNCDHPVFLQPTAEHPITRDLPWTTRPPLIGGLNEVALKSTGELLLEARHFRAEMTPTGPRLQPAGSDPLLVVSRHGRGRVACLMTDAAPHWVGPLVDWGDTRVSARAPGAGDVEVGNHYVQFFQQLLRWTMRGS